jgi:hypothetical protein
MSSRRLGMASIAISLVVAGCGGGSATTAGNPGQNQLVAYSHCMRSHGLPTFPDPVDGQGIPKGELPLTSPQFTSASNACQKLMPASGLGPQTTPEQTSTRVANALAFAGCIRRHGFPNFPDPTSGGQITHAMIAEAGINLHQPAVLQAADACVSVTHGQITKARVANFIAGR